MRKKAQFGQVISGYVDPTPEGLNKAYQRHMDNLINNESLRRQAASLKAAPFEGDQKMRRDLLSSTDSALNAVAQEASKNSFGNLSNFTNSVLRAGTLYQKGAAPLTENLKRYQTYQQQLSDSLEKGDIDADDYNINLGLSTSTYKGLEVNEEGDANNYFQGVKAWQDPKLLDMINKAMTNISVDGNLVVQDIIGFNNGMYDVRTTQGIKQIHPDKVNAALNGVFNDPRVQGYYGRKAQGMTLGKEDSEIVAALNKEIDQLKEAENPDLEAIGKIQQAIDSGNSETMRRKLEFDAKNSMLDTYRQAAVTGKQQMDTVNKRTVKYNPIYLEGVKAQMEASASGSSATGLVFTDNAIHYQTPGGGTAEGTDKEIKAVEKQVVSLTQEIAEGKESGLPPEELRYMEEQKDDLERDLVAKNNIFKYVYGLDRDQAKNDPEYKDLENRVRNNPLHSSSGGLFSAIKLGAAYAMEGVSPGMAYSQYQDYNDAKQDLRDYMVNNAPVKEDPRGETGSMALEYVPLSSFGMKPAVAKAMEQGVKDYFNNGGLKSNQFVIDPNSGETVTLDDFGVRPEDVQIENILVNRSLPMHGIPSHMKVNYNNPDDDSKGELLIPLTQSSGLQIPSVQDYFNTPAMKLIQELSGYSDILQGRGAGVMELDWAGSIGKDPTKPFYGTLDFNLDDQTVIVYDSEGKSMTGTQSLQNPIFTGAVNNNLIQLR